MKREERERRREAVQRIYDIIEGAETGLTDEERAARWDRFMAASDGVAARYEKRLKQRRTPVSRAASQKQ